MSDIPPHSKRGYSLDRGVPKSFGGNRPMKFKIMLTSGGYIEGIIPANEKLILCSEGHDFSDVQIVIDDESIAAIKEVT